MSWGSTIGAGFLTAIAGAAAATFLTYKCVDWYRLRNADMGELGYYMIFIPLGLVCGFVTGAVVSRMAGGFLPSLGYSFAGVLGAAALIFLVARTFGEVAPELNGDRLMLQVELRCPRGWQPDSEVRRPEARSCRLQPIGPGSRVGRPVYGNLAWKKAKEADGQWIVPCEVELFSSRENRLVAFIVGKEWIEFNLLRLSRKPTNENKNWSEWISEGFGHQTGKPPVVDFAYRYRVKGIRELRDEETAAHNAFWRQREDAAKAIPTDAPVAKWLPLFEDPDGSPAAYRWGGDERIERKAVAARVSELAPLLRSKDRTVVRQAVFALGSVYETPPVLVEPLLEAGRLTIELVREAKAQAPSLTDPDADPAQGALQFFNMWSNAMHNAGKVEDPELRKFLEDVQRETEGAKGYLWNIWKTAKDTEGALPAAPVK